MAGKVIYFAFRIKIQTVMYIEYGNNRVEKLPYVNTVNKNRFYDFKIWHQPGFYRVLNRKYVSAKPIAFSLNF